MDIESIKAYYQKLDSEALMLIVQNKDDEYEEDAVKIAQEELKSRGIDDIVITDDEKVIQIDTVRHYLDGALVEISKIFDGCEKRELDDEQIFSWMKDALQLLNASYNLRYLSLEETSKLSGKVWEEYLLPPKEFFA